MLPLIKLKHKYTSITNSDKHNKVHHHINAQQYANTDKHIFSLVTQLQ